jgi:hypothetical protein
MRVLNRRDKAWLTRHERRAPHAKKINPSPFSLLAKWDKKTNRAGITPALFVIMVGTAHPTDLQITSPSSRYATESCLDFGHFPQHTYMRRQWQ